MDKPLVSIVIATYNMANYLPLAVQSALAQTYRNIEVLIVDDGSTDRTATCAREFAARDDRVVVVSTAHRGLVGALETGLARCQAPIVARMDADDVMHRDRLALQLAALEA